MSRAVPLLIVLALGGSAARWLASLLRELRHETYDRADAFLSSNARLIGQIFVVLGVKAVERVGKWFRRAL